MFVLVLSLRGDMDKCKCKVVSQTFITFQREGESMSSERESPICFQTKTDSIWIPIGSKKKAWFGNTLGFPSHRTSGLLLADKKEVWFGNI